MLDKLLISFLYHEQPVSLWQTAVSLNTADLLFADLFDRNGTDVLKPDNDLEHHSTTSFASHNNNNSSSNQYYLLPKYTVLEKQITAFKSIGELIETDRQFLSYDEVTESIFAQPLIFSTDREYDQPFVSIIDKQLQLNLPARLGVLLLAILENSDDLIDLDGDDDTQIASRLIKHYTSDIDGLTQAELYQHNEFVIVFVSELNRIAHEVAAQYPKLDWNELYPIIKQRMFELLNQPLTFDRLLKSVSLYTELANSLSDLRAFIQSLTHLIRLPITVQQCMLRQVDCANSFVPKLHINQVTKQLSVSIDSDESIIILNIPNLFTLTTIIDAIQS